ncbi:chemotaxis protein MotA [Parasphingorhabdus marina DSM 22363]|uniref:Chemotaxis protein MotA n=1 Tax=Parasphingorhabdus marina DSM 22363 TaxID=1123272 RepID=A0A1N6CWE7_9SPHN|nr:MotA/TolQ/ExbB proton channel family protein [Parasphingorhabdus marina]SIN62809.1 chemotaxis protein MotA [Parasphingorhabdus marina DSM 22363]
MQQSLTNAMVFVDPLALCLVVLGSLILAGTQEGWRSFASAMSALPVAFRNDQHADAQIAKAAVKRVERMVEKRGIYTADRVKVDPLFVKQVIREMANQKNPAAFRDWAMKNIHEREVRHVPGARYWSTVSEIAPALGMIGTVIGLVLMFGHVEDAAAIGRAMAVAMLTTLYGLLLANLIAGPLAIRLARASESEIAWQREFAEELCRIAEREYQTGLSGVASPVSGRGFSPDGFSQCA